MKRLKKYNFLLNYINKSKKYLLLGLFGMLLAAISIVPVPYLIGYVLDNVILKSSYYRILMVIAFVLITLYIVNYLATLFYQYYFNKLQQNVVNDIKLDVIIKIINSHMCNIDKYEKGYLLARINEIQQISSLFSTNILGCATGIFEFILYLVVMFKLSNKLTLVILIIVPAYFIITKKLTRKIEGNTLRLQEASSVLNGSIYETLQGVEDIKILNAKDSQISKIIKKINNVIKNAINYNMNLIICLYSIVFTSNIITVLILVLSIVLIVRGEISIGIYTSFSIYIAKILGATHSLASVEMVLKPVEVTIERIKELLNVEEENGLNCKKFTEKIEKISCVDLGFKYKKNENYVFENLTTNFEKGDKVLLKGNNGSGKTTLIKLLLGLYEPSFGTMYINGIDYTQLNKDDIRKRVAIVSQNIFLFNCSVWENIVFGMKSKNRCDVEKMIEKLDLLEYINKFENGIDTIIQSNEGLSGGQKQIVTFLRAVIRDTDILIMDEATVNLDIEAEGIINKLLLENHFGKILIIVSHNFKKFEFINKQINMDNYKQDL